MNTELLFQTINSVNKISIYAVVTNCCYKFALKKDDKDHSPTHGNNQILAVVQPEEVSMMVSSPNLAQRNLMMQSETRFKVLEKEARKTQLCEKASFQYLATAGRRYQVRPEKLSAL